MKTLKILSFVLVAFVLSACATSKNTSADALYGSTWEMNYISGPRIAFEGLYPDKKPKIMFNKETGKVEGNNSCNGYSADFKVDANTISFSEPGMSTMMFCGQGENVFLSTIKKINKYKIDQNGELNLMIDEVPMMRFKKSN